MSCSDLIVKRSSILKPAGMDARTSLNGALCHAEALHTRYPSLAKLAVIQDAKR